MPLSIRERQSGSVTILELEGELRLGPETEALSERVKKVLKADRNRILLQLSELRRIDSVGIGTIIDAVRVVREAGGDLRLLQLSQPVGAVFDLLGLRDRPDFVRVFLDEQEALKSFHVPAPS